MREGAHSRRGSWTTSVRTLIDYRSMLRDASEPGLAEFSSKLTPGKEGIMGVRIPVLRSIAKSIVRDDWRSFLCDTPACFEEEMLRGLVIATAPMDVEERISMTGSFLPYIDNWATCDIFCNSWKCSKKDADRAWGYFSDLMLTGEEYPMRVSVVMRMGRIDSEGRAEALLRDISEHDHEGYYYRMGAAWAVSECYVKYPELTRTVLESGRIPEWTHNKSIQKIRESYRVPREDKEELRALRRRAP